MQRERPSPAPADAAGEFIERMGIVAQADGLPRIAGRLMGYFVIHGGPVSFGELAERLQVSRASISGNTRLLESLGVIERLSRPGERQDYFRLAHAPYRRLLEGAVERMARARRTVEEADAAIPDEGARRRLRELAEFYSSAEASTRALLDRLEGNR